MLGALARSAPCGPGCVGRRSERPPSNKHRALARRPLPPVSVDPPCPPLQGREPGCRTRGTGVGTGGLRGGPSPPSGRRRQFAGREAAVEATRRGRASFVSALLERACGRARPRPVPPGGGGASGRGPRVSTARLGCTTEGLAWPVPDGPPPAPAGVGEDPLPPPGLRDSARAACGTRPGRPGAGLGPCLVLHPVSRWSASRRQLR